MYQSIGHTWRPPYRIVQQSFRPKNVLPTPMTTPSLVNHTYADLDPNFEFHYLCKSTKYHYLIQELPSRGRETPTVPLHDPPGNNTKNCYETVKGEIAKKTCMHH